MNFFKSLSGAATSVMRSAGAPSASRGASASLSSTVPPKRPSSAYFLFLRSMPKAETYPMGSKATVRSKRNGEKWAALDAATKATYTAEAAELNARYQRSKAAWEADFGPVNEFVKPKLKRSQTGYQCYWAEIKPSFPADQKFGEQSAAVSRRWKALTDAEKAPYVARAERLTEQDFAEAVAAAAAENAERAVARAAKAAAKL